MTAIAAALYQRQDVRLCLQLGGEPSIPWMSKLDRAKLPTGSDRPWVSRSAKGLLILKPRIRGVKLDLVLIDHRMPRARALMRIGDALRQSQARLEARGFATRLHAAADAVGVAVPRGRSRCDGDVRSSQDVRGSLDR